LRVSTADIDFDWYSDQLWMQDPVVRMSRDRHKYSLFRDHGSAGSPELAILESPVTTSQHWS